MIKIKFKKVLTACLVAVQIFSFAACGEESKEKESSKAISNTAKATADSTSESEKETPVNTEKSTATAEQEDAKSTTEPTATPILKPTVEPTEEPTKAPQPTADPNLNLDEWGWDQGPYILRKGRKAIIWKKTMHLVEFPEQINKSWYPEFVDEKNEQIFLSTGKFSEGTLQYYCVRDGIFYKLSEGKIIKKGSNGVDGFIWIEEDGTGYSVGVRSHFYNEVYIEAKGIKGIFFDEGSIWTDKGKTTEEDILRNIQIIK